MDDHPQILAIGLVWRKRANSWVAYWQAPPGHVRRGWRPTAVPLWHGPGDPLPEQVIYVQDQCARLQDQMRTWAAGGIPLLGAFDGTLGSLILAYQSDQDSTYRKLRYRTRLNYDSLCRRLKDAHGAEPVSDVKARVLLHWHQEWAATGHITQAHSYISMLRTLFSFGATMLESEECERLCGVMHKMRFPGSPVRKSVLTAEQANAIRARAHDVGLPSIALAQALQFELMLRQRDVIGEWVPYEEPGSSEIKDVALGMKWLRGLRWSFVDVNLILRHVTSKRGKTLEADLRLAPMVMEELSAKIGQLPTSGPLIVNERTGLPWNDLHFRRAWRKLADAVGVPKDVENRDSRAGGITEATDAGAELEHVRHAATHSDIAMTQRYSRGSVEKTANVMRLRVKHRTKGET